MPFFRSTIKIGNKWVGEKQPVLIIAEAGVNHNGNLRLAKKMIESAAELGADAVKFQSYKTENIITRMAPSAKYHIRATGGRQSWFELLKKLELSNKDQLELFNYCKKRKILFLSTPYDVESAEFLNNLGVSAFKISSCDLNNTLLLRFVAKFRKPIILSTGMSDMKEIEEALDLIKKTGNNRVVLLQCTSNYPPRLEDININAIDCLRKNFNVSVGYSDHSGVFAAAIAAVAKGACIYEVHYTLNKRMQGPDQKASVEPCGLKKIISNIRLTEKILGSYDKKITPSERETRVKMRKSIVSVIDISAGDIFTEKNLGIKRPGTGIAPNYFSRIIGTAARRNIPKDSLIRFTDVK